jgi:hypothetical protein
MHLIPFYVVDAKLAGDETRVINLFEPHQGIPPGRYNLIEYYCPDPACDCRRVMLNIAEGEELQHFEASISYGFDRDQEMAGPFLDPMNPQGKYARQLLDVVESWVLSDPHYVARLERHYALVKQAAADPQHPAHPRLQEVLAADAGDFSLPESLARREPRRKRHRRRVVSGRTKR